MDKGSMARLLSCSTKTWYSAMWKDIEMTVADIPVQARIGNMFPHTEYLV